MTDPTYENESPHDHHTRHRDARLVGHEVKADTSADGLGAYLSNSEYSAILSERDTLKAEAEGAHAIIAAERAEAMKLREENERLLEAFCVNMLRHGYDHADIDDVLSVCYALKGDSHD